MSEPVRDENDMGFEPKKMRIIQWNRAAEYLSAYICWKKKHRERERDTHPISTHLQMNVIDSLWNDRNDIMAHTTLKESENSKEEICLFPLKRPSESQIPIIFVCMLWAQIALHGVTKVHFSILSPKRIKMATENFHNHNDIAIENSPNVLTSLDSCVSIIHRAMYP